MFNIALASNESPASPNRQYAKRMTELVESQNAELTIIRKELQECRELLQTRKKELRARESNCKANLCLVLKIVREADEKPKEKRARGRPRKRPIEKVEAEEGEEVENSSCESELDLDDCVAPRTRSNLVVHIYCPSSPYVTLYHLDGPLKTRWLHIHDISS